MDCERVRADNFNKYHTNLYIEKDGIITEEEIKVQLEENRVRYELSGEERLAVKIPFYRRNTSNNNILENIFYLEKNRHAKESFYLYFPRVHYVHRNEQTISAFRKLVVEIEKEEKAIRFGESKYKPFYLNWWTCSNRILIVPRSPFL